MLWCLIIPAVMCVLMALLTLRLPVGHFRLPRLHPRRLLRGCFAGLFLLAAMIFGGLAFAAVHPWR